MTWVLFLTAITASGPTGLTSVPGFHTEISCTEAGRAYTARVAKTSFDCIRGPGSAKPVDIVEWWQTQRQD